MRLTCPQCNALVTADHINIQQMVAACLSCSNVFQFTVTEPKSKRRKVRQPRNLQLHEAEGLHLAYRTNFRLDRDENFISSVILSTVFTLLALVMSGGYLAGEMPVSLPFIFGLVALPMYYWLGLIVFNKTHIYMDSASIQVSRKPLPSIGQTREIDLSNVTAVSTEETKASKQKEYDTPRYHVWANMPDNSRKIIVADIAEDYAYFIVQKLDDKLQQGMDVNISRLKMNEQTARDDFALDAEETRLHEKQDP